LTFDVARPAPAPFGFAGAYTDSTGMIYLGGRYCDPQSPERLVLAPRANIGNSGWDDSGCDVSRSPTSRSSAQCKNKGSRWLPVDLRRPARLPAWLPAEGAVKRRCAYTLVYQGFSGVVFT